MHVNRACREKVIELVSSLTWIELRSLDSKHTDLVRRLASQISSIDPFWSSIVLDGGRAGHVILELGRKTTRSTRRHANDNTVFFSPYSYSSMLRLVSEIGLALPDIDRLNTRLEWIPRGHLEEVESVVKFLNTHTIMTAKPGSDGRDFSFPRHVPSTMDLLLDFIGRISLEFLEQFGEQTRASHLRCKLKFLYISRCLMFEAESVLRSPYSWTAAALDGPHWRSNAYATRWIKIVQMLHTLEMNALQAFCDVLETDYEWMNHHTPYLTNEYLRFINEPRFTYFSISGDELVEYYRNVGRVVSIYNAMNRLTLEPIQDRSLLCERLRRKTHALTCASKLDPEKECWEDDAREALLDLLRYFPQEGREELMRDYNFHQYTDIDGDKRTWLENDICPWDTRSLQYLHRARQVNIFSTTED